MQPHHRLLCVLLSKVAVVGVLELIVESMGGDVAEFHGLWLAASDPEGATPLSSFADRGPSCGGSRGTPPSRDRCRTAAGDRRGRDRKDANRRDCSGLRETLFVARGSALPLSAQVPLLPITDALRSIYQVDDGRWLKAVLADGPSDVRVALCRLLPELHEDGEATVVQDEDLWRQRLFSAVASTWAALSATRPLGILIEDLHWADSTTLDLLEHLLTVGQEVPIVGTWRRDDLTVPSEVRDWLTRVRRLPRVDELRRVH